MYSSGTPGGTGPTTPHDLRAPSKNANITNTHPPSIPPNSSPIRFNSGLSVESNVSTPAHNLSNSFETTKSHVDPTSTSSRFSNVGTMPPTNAMNSGLSVESNISTPGPDLSNPFDAYKSHVDPSSTSSGSSNGGTLPPPNTMNQSLELKSADDLAREAFLKDQNIESESKSRKKNLRTVDVIARIKQAQAYDVRLNYNVKKAQGEAAQALAMDKVIAEYKSPQSLAEESRSNIEACKVRLLEELEANYKATLEYEAMEAIQRGVFMREAEIASTYEQKIRTSTRARLVRDLEPVVMAELSALHASEIKKQLKGELLSEVRSELMAQYEPVVKQQLKSNLDTVVRSELRAELLEEVRKELKRELTTTIRKEVEDATLLQNFATGSQHPDSTNLNGGNTETIDDSEHDVFEIAPEQPCERPIRAEFMAQSPLSEGFNATYMPFPPSDDHDPFSEEKQKTTLPIDLIEEDDLLPTHSATDKDLREHNTEEGDVAAGASHHEDSELGQGREEEGCTHEEADKEGDVAAGASHHEDSYLEQGREEEGCTHEEADKEGDVAAGAPHDEASGLGQGDEEEGHTLEDESEEEEETFEEWLASAYRPVDQNNNGDVSSPSDRERGIVKQEYPRYLFGGHQFDENYDSDNQDEEEDLAGETGLTSGQLLEPLTTLPETSPTNEMPPHQRMPLGGRFIDDNYDFDSQDEVEDGAGHNDLADEQSQQPIGSVEDSHQSIGYPDLLPQGLQHLPSSEDGEEEHDDTGHDISAHEQFQRPLGTYPEDFQTRESPQLPQLLQRGMKRSFSVEDEDDEDSYDPRSSKRIRNHAYTYPANNQLAPSGPFGDDSDSSNNNDGQQNSDTEVDSSMEEDSEEEYGEEEYSSEEHEGGVYAAQGIITEANTQETAITIEDSDEDEDQTLVEDGALVAVKKPQVFEEDELFVPE